MKTQNEVFEIIKPVLGLTHEMGGDGSTGLTHVSDPLSIEWKADDLGYSKVWCPNVPLSSKGGDDYILKAIKGNSPAFMILNVRTDSKRWQELVFPYASWICFFNDSSKALVAFQHILTISEGEVIDTLGYVQENF